ncbi:alpha/beta hydrolase [Haloechinothrix sp. YIM 98757]|uniref:Alpha/beta hydrolase n=1 Tax=Haloechinothrix aidingensis TaxID=2752311 RepID=A0A838A671_9PSEU|nr:alpha/beta hydrolase [Haloechinothrix aidingensis]MBA0125310.1 alpha/beta hydrolase [Haloechinothrix aidingensis]
MVESANAANVENVGFGVRGLELETVTSADGTRIAFERSGDGPPVVILGGGLNEKAMFARLAEALSDQFTVFNYDRRGRGGSGDAQPAGWSIEREVEDLAAVVEATGGRASVFANCTGGMIGIRAAADGVPMGKLAVYEPPYGGPKVPDGYLDELKRLIAEDRRGDAVTLFLKEDVFFSDEVIDELREHPVWPSFEALAPTIVYDAILSDDHERVPADLLPSVPVDTLVISGSDSADWLLETCRSVAEGIPRGRFVSLPSEGHLFNQKLGAPLLAEYFLS